MVILIFVNAVHTSELLSVYLLLLHLVLIQFLDCGQRDLGDVVEVFVSPVVLVGLLEHDPVCGGGVEDLLEHNVGDVGNQSNHW